MEELKMLSVDKMKDQVSKYMLSFDISSKEVYLIKPRGDVKISTERAIEWVEVGIDDLDCRSKVRMLEILNSWK
jgi:hypothetical protein